MCEKAARPRKRSRAGMCSRYENRCLEALFQKVMCCSAFAYISSLAQANITFKHHLQRQTSHRKEERLFATLPFLHMVRMKGLEPPRRWHWFLRPARLPVPPHPHIYLTMYIIAYFPFHCQVVLFNF